MQHSVVKEKSYKFALRIVRLCRRLQEQNEFVLSRQTLQAGTSIGANVEEALAAQSRADFLSKMSIASKEARESNYWLRILRDSGYIPAKRLEPLIEESEVLIKLLTAIVKTTAASLKNSKLKTKN